MINSKITFNDAFALKSKAVEKYKDQIDSINKRLKNGEIVSSQYFGCFEIEKNIKRSDYEEIKKIPQWMLDENIEYLVVVAAKHIALQSESLIDITFGKFKFDQKIKILFVEENMNGRDIAQLLHFLETKRFAINIISQTGESLETLIVFRELKALLYKLLGKVNASKYIFATTNNNYGKLFNEVKVNGYKHLILLDNTTEKFLNYSAAILLPLACAGINIDEYLRGAKIANHYFMNSSINENPAAQYAVARKILFTNNFIAEHINVYSPSDTKLGQLFQMYLSEATLKNKQGIYVQTQLQPQSTKTFSENNVNIPIKMFETSLLLEKPKYDYRVSVLHDKEDDYFSYLTTYTYNKLGDVLSKTVIDNHVRVFKIPNLRIFIADYSNETLGWIIAFIHHASTMMAFLQDSNPFINQGIDSYKVDLLKNITELNGGSNYD